MASDLPNLLGVMLVYCRHVAWVFLRSGVWRVAASNRTGNFNISVLGLRSELWVWYASRRLSHFTENLTQVADDTPGPFGSMEDPNFEDEGRRDLVNVVVLGHMGKFARC